MPTDGKKGITVKIDAELHAEVRQFLEQHNMTMAEFITMALDDELHPKLSVKENQNMGNMRTIAVQVPEDLYQRIKEYLQRNNMTQKEFLIGLIEDELERDLTERESLNEAQDATEGQDEEMDEQEETAPVNDYEGVSDEDEEFDESEYDEQDEAEEMDEIPEDEEEIEDEGMSLSM